MGMANGHLAKMDSAFLCCNIISEKVLRSLKRSIRKLMGNEKDLHGRPEIL